MKQTTCTRSTHEGSPRGRDPASVRLVSVLSSELHRAGTTILLVTHDDDLAHRADSVVEPRGGRDVAPVPAAPTSVAS